ncbi:DUF2804 domain-containing protein [Roseateles saccharophilus]|uniref:Uncharacterized protein DUF2804 n=1 Tax=Roseateles saccharophilus TaxID=304 RepID=A0A4R3UNW2_ROSSA|nr:DUF2804 domain-containing protein [Roseateles saccharophilus]MDG0833569.1 DUF2804 domain-containing protein [Roseateles saccharophilus]TCU92183.1 uncharacterized protein DUF2804 [Roseateles saccharophilus]
MNSAIPDSIVRHDGQPAHGRYAGRIARFDWTGLAERRSWLWRRLHHKRWHYVGLGDERVFIGLAIVDVGWTCTAFAYLFDRQRRHLLADWSQDGLPGLQAQVSDAPLAEARACFRGPGARLELRHQSDDSLLLHVRTRTLRIEAQLDLEAMAPPLLAVGPIEGGIAHATQKTTALAVLGWAEAEGRRFDLDGAWAAVDASNGLLARNTAWRWASAHRPDVGFNLQQGYFGNQENVLWLDGRPIALGAAHFDFDAARPLDPWHVRTDDGLLDLVFTPEGARAEDRNLLVAASHYIQPIGSFAGTVRAAPGAPLREVRDLLGVTEDHRSKW